MNKLRRNIEYWTSQTTKWFELEVHGKEGFNIIAINGQVLIEFDESWSDEDIKTVYQCLHGEEFPSPRYDWRDIGNSDGTNRIRFDATDERLTHQL